MAEDVECSPLQTAAKRLRADAEGPLVFGDEGRKQAEAISLGGLEARIRNGGL